MFEVGSHCSSQTICALFSGCQPPSITLGYAKELDTERNITEPVDHGTQASVSCHQGLSLSDLNTSVIVCQEGVWNFSILECFPGNLSTVFLGCFLRNCWTVRQAYWPKDRHAYRSKTVRHRHRTAKTCISTVLNSTISVR